MLIAGVDEAGRGPLIGSVVAAAVIWDGPITGIVLNDSKKLSPKRREALYELILEGALTVGVGEASANEIDTLNILQASLLAMRRAITKLRPMPTEIKVDGLHCPDVPIPCQAIVKGDQLVPEISAASIVAKVTRDRMMVALDEQHPEYGFAQHKGYPTKGHIKALEQYGILPLHHKTFKPVATRILDSV